MFLTYRSHNRYNPTYYIHFTHELQVYLTIPPQAAIQKDPHMADIPLMGQNDLFSLHEPTLFCSVAWFSRDQASVLHVS